MKRLILVILLTPTFLSYSQKQPNFLQGAWKQISFEQYANDKLVTKNLITENTLKMFSEKNWSFIKAIRADTVTKYQYGSGTYTLNGNEFVEKIEMHFSPFYVGKTLKMKMEVNRDTLIQTWNPLDFAGKQNGYNKLVEKYIRLQ